MRCRDSGGSYRLLEQKKAGLKFKQITQGELETSNS